MAYHVNLITTFVITEAVTPGEAVEMAENKLEESLEADELTWNAEVPEGPDAQPGDYQVWVS